MTCVATLSRILQPILDSILDKFMGEPSGISILSPSDAGATERGGPQVSVARPVVAAAVDPAVKGKQPTPGRAPSAGGSHPETKKQPAKSKTSKNKKGKGGVAGGVVATGLGGGGAAQPPPPSTPVHLVGGGKAVCIAAEHGNVRAVTALLGAGAARCAPFGRNSQVRMPLDPTHVRFKQTCV
jgi:hypothetical protein